jgi:hypothetical protein
MRSLLLALSLAALAASCAHEAHPSRPAPPVVHPHLALDEPGAVAIAQSYAWDRGLQSEVKKVSREPQRWLVDLKITGETKGKLDLAVDAKSGRVLVLKEELRLHDQGKHGPKHGDVGEEKGHGKGHDEAAGQGNGWDQDERGDHGPKDARHEGKHKGQGKKGDKD